MSGPAETGWLIEAPGHGQPLYWDGASWTADPSAAVRYARNVDAERVIAASHLVGAKATEHMWCPPPAAAPPPSRTEFVANPAPDAICASCGRRGDDHHVRHPFTRMKSPPEAAASPSWREG